MFIRMLVRGISGLMSDGCMNAIVYIPPTRPCYLDNQFYQPQCPYTEPCPSSTCWLSSTIKASAIKYVLTLSEFI
jgi:hypothetical protein